MSSFVRKIHFARDNHSEFVFSDLLYPLRRLELCDFYAEPFVFQFELLRLSLCCDQRITSACTDSATYYHCHCQHREDYKENSAT